MSITDIVLPVLGAIEELLPALGIGGGAGSTVNSVIAALGKIVPVVEKVAPLAVDEASLVRQGIKNIISNIRGTATTAEQDAALDDLDARVDAGWDKIAPKFDPDAPASA